MNRITFSHPYPTGYGFKVSIQIERDFSTDTARVHVIAPFYMRKRWTLLHGYRASQFTDVQIFRDRDCCGALARAYGPV